MGHVSVVSASGVTIRTETWVSSVGADQINVQASADAADLSAPAIAPTPPQIPPTMAAQPSPPIPAPIPPAIPPVPQDESQNDPDPNLSDTAGETGGEDTIVPVPAPVHLAQEQESLRSRITAVRKEGEASNK